MLLPPNHHRAGQAELRHLDARLAPALDNQRRLIWRHFLLSLATKVDILSLSLSVCICIYMYVWVGCVGVYIYNTYRDAPDRV